MRSISPWKILKIAAVAALAIGAVGLVIMSLWNWLAPAMFGGHLIGFWQAVGVFVLARLLVGGLRGRGHRHSHGRYHMEAMSDAERERFRQGFGRRCGGRGADDAGGQPA
jgi:hypothetical protein